jgi:hypothetical protein
MISAIRCVAIALAMLIFMPAFALAQEPVRYMLPTGTSIPLVIAQQLSSKTSVKGDMVKLRTAADIMVEGHIVITKGTYAAGQIADARAKGAMGMNGKLAIRPLYIRVGDDFVRLGGASSQKGSVTAGAVIGLAVLSPGFTGRSAVIPEGTALEASIEHGIALAEITPSVPVK